jgi:hypothetical protein
MRQILPLLFLSAASCTEVQLPAAGAGSLDPIAFFVGNSHGEGQLHQVLGKPRFVRVVSAGRTQPGGALLLTQRIAEEGKAPRTRKWLMRPTGPGRYTGTLTDAVGPVDLTVTGRRAQVRYTMKKGLKVKQELALQPDGLTILNRLEVYKLGIRVAWLNETIRKERR